MQLINPIFGRIEKNWAIKDTQMLYSIDPNDNESRNKKKKNK